MSDFFAGARTAHPTRSGSVELPILYREAVQFGVFFQVDLDAARALLQDAPVEPWPVFGRAMAAIYAWQYLDTSVGPYGEVGLGVQARRRGTKPSLIKLGVDMEAQDDQGIWVVDLPVTSEAALHAGIDLWGYPKYLSPIAITSTPERAEARLGDELRLAVGRVGGPRTRLPVVTYTKKDGRLLRTTIATDHLVQWGGGGAAELELLGDGPTAKSARALGLHARSPLLAFRTPNFRARLPAGADLGPA